MHKVPQDPNTGAYNREDVGTGMFYPVPGVEEMPEMPEMPTNKVVQKPDYHKMEPGPEKVRG